MLFIDEAYYLYRPENERDYGQESIEILLQVMENERDDLVVVLAGYRRPHGLLLPLQPGMGSRIAHHIDFPTMHWPSSGRSAGCCSRAQNYRLCHGGQQGRCCADYVDPTQGPTPLR